MGLNQFVSREPRALPIFVLADVSGSMIGAKINELNIALREMVSMLQKVDDVRGKFQLCVITIGTEAKLLVPLTDIEKVQLPELGAGGRTSLGAAITMANELIDNRDIVSSRAYTPTIVLVSDGMPTDCDPALHENGRYNEWDVLVNLHTGERTKKCQKLALGIGDDADTNMLKAFINDPEVPVIKSKNVDTITKFFRWVTMSTVARMSSVNPDFITPASITFDFDDEDLII